MSFQKHSVALCEMKTSEGSLSHRAHAIMIIRQSLLHCEEARESDPQVASGETSRKSGNHVAIGCQRRRQVGKS